MNELATEEWMYLIQKHSGLDEGSEQNILDEHSAVETLKCLCNIIFNSPVALTMVTTNGTLDNIIKRIKKYK